MISSEEFAAMEVRASRNGWYKVTLFQFKKDKPKDPDYFDDWLEHDLEDGWDYEDYEGSCYVCFIKEKEAPEVKL